MDEHEWIIEDEYNVYPDYKSTTTGDQERSVPTFSKENDDIENDLTQKFLNGEISFAEYSSEWYEKSPDDYDIAEKSEEEPTSSSVTSKCTSSASEVGIKRRRRTILSPALLGLMGEANIRFVRGDIETAEKMCHEIIRRVPTSPEPYQTLAQIYENDPDKCLQYSLLAAHLSPPDAEEWLRLAAISKQRNEYKQEMICYTQTIKADPQNLSYHLKRIDLFKRLDEANIVLQNRLTYQACYHRIVKSLPPTEYGHILDYAKKAATLYHKSNELEKALEVMKDAFDKCAAKFTMEDLNLILELMITQKQYKEALDILIAHSGLEVEAIIETIADGETIQEHTRYIACRIPNTLPIDIKTKVLICFIYLNSTEIFEELLNEFLDNDVEKAGDLFMDVEEVLSNVGQYELALRLLEILINSENYSLGAVWLRHAECLIHLERESDAIASLQKVIELAPQHVDARRKLFSILEKTGKNVGAVHVLEQDYSKPINSKLMYEYCQVLKEQKDFTKFLEVGEALLSRTFMKFRQQEELRLVRLSRLSHALSAIATFRAERDEDPYDPDALVFDDEIITPEEEWTLMQDMLDVAFERNNYVLMQRLIFGAYTSKVSMTHRQELDFQCLQICLLQKDYRNAYTITKEFLHRVPEYPRIWNVFCNVQQIDNDQNQAKYLVRLYERYNKLVPHINMFLGNSYLTSGRYQTALRYYLEYHELERNNPVAPLMIAITMLIMACQRIVDKHHLMVLQGMSYMMKYKDVRQYDQEAYYNIGRAYHMLSLTNLAVHYYEKALAAPSIECEQHEHLNVKREAAFNLFQIYKAGSPHLARMILQKYLVF